MVCEYHVPLLVVYRRVIGDLDRDGEELEHWGDLTGSRLAALAFGSSLHLEDVGL